MRIGWTELLLVLLLVLVLFGSKKLPDLARSLGKSVRELKKGLNGAADDAAPDDVDEKKGS